MFYSKATNKVWLEASTERSESNPGRSLGITNNSWRAVWKTVPHDMLTRLCLARHVQNLSRITPMRRICSFTDFLCVLLDFLRLPGAGIFTDYLLLKAIQHRIGAKTIRSKSYINWQHKKK